MVAPTAVATPAYTEVSQGFTVARSAVMAVSGSMVWVSSSSQGLEQAVRARHYNWTKA